MDIGNTGLPAVAHAHEQDPAADATKALLEPYLDFVDSLPETLGGMNSFPDARPVSYAGGDHSTGEKRRKKSRSRASDERAAEQNRLAQQRYRARQRDKVATLSSEISRLEDRVKKLEQCERENADLNLRLCEANKRIRDLEQENIKLKASVASSDGNCVDGKRHDGKPSSLAEVKEIFQTCVDNLNEELAKCGPQIDEQCEARLQDNIVQVLETCAKSFDLHAPDKVESVAEGDAALGSLKGQELSLEEWFRLACDAKIDQRQSRLLLAEWGDLRRALDELFESRESINNSIKQIRTEFNITERTYRCIEKAQQRHSERGLMEEVDRLRQNISSEIRMVIRFERTCWLGILTPWQTAKMLVNSFPAHLNACALCTALNGVQDDCDFSEQLVEQVEHTA